MTVLVTATVHTVMESPVGRLTLTTDGECLTGIYFAGHRRRRTLPESGRAVAGDPILRETARQLGEYFARERVDFDLPLAVSGDQFERVVWHQLTTIPYGTTRSYGEIARAVDRPGAGQAVGVAMSANPYSIVVPCHRVVGSDGSLTGFAGGLDTKRFLLELERPPADEDGRLF